MISVLLTRAMWNLQSPVEHQKQLTRELKTVTKESLPLETLRYLIYSIFSHRELQPRVGQPLTSGSCTLNSETGGKGRNAKVPVVNFTHIVQRSRLACSIEGRDLLSIFFKSKYKVRTSGIKKSALECLYIPWNEAIISQLQIANLQLQLYLEKYLLLS